jgi:hypothetical protein
METLAEIKDFDYVLKKNKNIVRLLNEVIYFLRITSHMEDDRNLYDYEKINKKKQIIKAISYLQDEIKDISEKLKSI